MWARGPWDCDWQGLAGLEAGWTGRLTHWAGLPRGFSQGPGWEKKEQATACGDGEVGVSLEGEPQHWLLMDQMWGTGAGKTPGGLD